MATASSTLTPVRKVGKNRLWNERNLTIVLFLLPTLVFMGIFVVWPILNSLQLSFYEWNGIDPDRTLVAAAARRRILKIFEQ